MTQTSDLWESLSAVSGRDIAKEMGIWTKKVGYPILTVTESDRIIHVRQDRFLQSRDATDLENKTLYPVSLGLVTSTGAGKVIGLETREMDVELEDMNFKLNSKHAGFYRTLYTPERLVKLGKSMNAGMLSVEDRIGVIADALALALSGYQKTSGLLGLLANLKDEKNPFVWKQINSSLTAIRDAFKFEDESLHQALIMFKRDLVAPQAKALGWDFNSKKEDMSMVKHKAEMFEAAGEAEDPV
jgi:aminopeptidase 2